MAEGYYETTPSAADIMTAEDSHGEAMVRYTPMRGQAYVEMVREESRIITMRGDPNEEKWYRGRIIALGPPARLTDHPDAPETPWDCDVGDEVLFVLAVWMDRFRVMRMFGVSGEVAVLAQVEIMGVIE